MNGLLVRETLTLDSKEVAKMMEVNHWEILRKLEGGKDRKGYIEILNDNQMVVADYFIKSVYLDDKKEERPCYKLTKMGCEFLANKFTGEKGIIFTAKYVRKFNEMENKVQQPLLNDLSPQLQFLIQMELKQSQLEAAVTETKQVLIDMKGLLITNDKDWRKWTNDKLREIGATLGDYRRPRNESYVELEKRGRCNLETRLTNRIVNMKVAGAGKSAISNANYLDVIGEDARLKEIYTSIVKEMCIKYL